MVSPGLSTDFFDSGGCTLSPFPLFSTSKQLVRSLSFCLPLEYDLSLSVNLDPPPADSEMLRVIVESASGIPKKKLGNPDPIAAIVFRGEKCASTQQHSSVALLPFLDMHDTVLSWYTVGTCTTPDNFKYVKINLQ